MQEESEERKIMYPKSLIMVHILARKTLRQGQRFLIFQLGKLAYIFLHKKFTKTKHIVTPKVGDNTKRGEVYWADLQGGVGSEQGNKRPVLIIQNDYGNKNSPTTIVAPISTHSKEFVTHVYCRNKSLDYRSQILLEQIRVLDKSRIEKYICTLNPDVMDEVDEKIKISLALNKKERGERVNELQIFNSEEFGDIRTMNIDGQPWFVGFDVADALGYKNQSDAIMKHIAEEDRRVIQKSQITTLADVPNRGFTFINESGLYALIFGSKLESAQRFKRWVTSEVLPSIRKTGGYQKPLTPEQMMRIQLEMIDDVSGRVTKLENTMNIDYGQQRVLEKEVAAVVIESLGGKDSNAYREISKKVFSECNRDVKDYFHVNSRNNIPRLRFDEAIDYVRNWFPCSNTRMLIKECNAQIGM